MLPCGCSVMLAQVAKISNMPAAGVWHTVLLNSAGTAAAFGANDSGQCNIPALPDGVIYTQAAAGRFHTVLLKSDGTAAAVGGNAFGQCNIPALPERISYTQVAAAKGLHTVLLRSDGTAVAFGANDSGQCNIPALPEGVTYTQAATGSAHTVLLKSDGTVAAFGLNYSGQCNIPALPGSGYTRSSDQMPRIILNIQFGGEYAAFYTLSGEEVLRVQVSALDTLNDLRLKCANGVAGTRGRYCAALPTGALLDELCAQTPAASLEPWLPRKRARVIHVAMAG